MIESISNLLGINQGLYIDPAATSVLLASITSIAVAAGAVFIILWRKFKKGVKKTFHIDENAGKEVEDDLVILDDTVNAEEGNAAEEVAADTAEEAAEEKTEEAQKEEQPQEEKAEAKPEEVVEEKPVEKPKKPATSRKPKNKTQNTQSK